MGFAAGAGYFFVLASDESGGRAFERSGLSGGNVSIDHQGCTGQAGFGHRQVCGGLEKAGGQQVESGGRHFQLRLAGGAAASGSKTTSGGKKETDASSGAKKEAAKFSRHREPVRQHATAPK